MFRNKDKIYQVKENVCKVAVNTKKVTLTLVKEPHTAEEYFDLALAIHYGRPYLGVKFEYVLPSKNNKYENSMAVDNHALTLFEKAASFPEFKNADLARVFIRSINQRCLFRQERVDSDKLFSELKGIPDNEAIREACKSIVSDIVVSRNMAKEAKERGDQKAEQELMAHITKISKDIVAEAKKQIAHDAEALKELEKRDAKEAEQLREIERQVNTWKR